MGVLDGGQTEEPLRVGVITGSTRQGRVGERITEWFAARARQREGIDLHVIDLIDFEFPARFPASPTPHMRTFAGRVNDADAFVVVTPEYNRSYPAALKQAIDYAYDEWQAKAVGFVSYGFESEGRHAVEHLRAVFNELHTVTVRNTVSLHVLDGPALSSALLDTDGPAERGVAAMLDQLVWWGLALRDARAARSYAT